MAKDPNEKAVQDSLNTDMTTGQQTNNNAQQNNTQPKVEEEVTFGGEKVNTPQAAPQNPANVQNQVTSNQQNGRPANYGTMSAEEATAYVNSLGDDYAGFQLSSYDQQLDKETQAKILAQKKQWYIANAMGDKAGETAANNAANLSRATTGAYTGGADGSGYNPFGNNSTNAAPASKLQSAADLKSNLADLQKQWYDASLAQANNQIDYATQQGIDELQRAQEDAQAAFRERQNQITSEEMNNRDNAALYAEMRGDRGGIGQDQYTDVMNTAAINRQTVASEQTKLSTDTARQIADLRAQGEYKKADSLLQLTQTYLSQLMELEQYAANYGLSVAQFEESVREFEAQYELSKAQITGTYQGELTYEAKRDQISDDRYNAEWAYNVAQNDKQWQYQLDQDAKDAAKISVQWSYENGLPIDAEQGRIYGLTQEQIDAYNTELLAKQALTSTGGGGGGGGGGGAKAAEDFANDVGKGLVRDEIQAASVRPTDGYRDMTPAEMLEIALYKGDQSATDYLKSIGFPETAAQYYGQQYDKQQATAKK